MNFSEPPTANPTLEDTIHSLQHWWELAGVDLHYQEHPNSLIAPSAAVPRAEQPVRDSVTESVPVNESVAPKTIEYPDELHAFQQFLARDENLLESAWARQFSQVEGPAKPKVMAISAIPEKNSKQGLSALGETNQALAEKMLAAIGCDSQQAYFTTIALARPIDGQLDKRLWQSLRQRIEHHIKLVQPDRIICFGDLASRIFFESDLLSARKKKLNLNHVSSKTEVIVTFHPRILIERPELKAEAWKDLQRLTRIVAS